MNTILNNNKRKRKIINIPGSKSITNRILFILSVLNVRIKIKNMLWCDDSKAMVKFLLNIGLKIKKKNNYIKICKNSQYNNFHYGRRKINIGNSGLTVRILLCYYLTNNIGKLKINCDKNMRNRPMDEIFKILKRISKKNTKVKFLNKRFRCPMIINKNYIIENNKTIEVTNNNTSQFATGLVQQKRIIKNNIKLRNRNYLSYIMMTIKLIRILGYNIRIKDKLIFDSIVKNNKIIKVFRVETDATQLSYVIVNSIIHNNNNYIYKLHCKIQPELKLLYTLKKMVYFYAIRNITVIKPKTSVIKIIFIDGKNIPDSVISMCVLPWRDIFLLKIYNIKTWKLKECNRIKSITKEIKKLGCLIKKGKNWLIIINNKVRNNIYIKTYSDHRIAMTFNNIKGRNSIITYPNCVKKTWPMFFFNM